MATSGENNPAFIQPAKETGGGRRVRNNRRALSVINQSLVGSSQACRCVVNKRGLPENNAVGEKIAADPVHRPVTRSFAAQQERTLQQACPEESKKLKPTVPRTNEFGELIFVDAEESKPPSDHPVPMSLEKPESKGRPNDADQTEEVEMEDIDEDPVLDIDGSDARNPLAVVEYVEDLYAHYRRIEIYGCVPQNYISQQLDINEKMRAILIDWLIEVHDKFELMNETLFLTVNLIDRFLAQKAVVRKKLQLVGLVSMLLACKYEEVSVPVVSDLILISDKAYTRQEVLEMERLMLNALQFNMSFPTPFVFLQRFLKAAQSDRKLELMSFFLIELCLVEYEMLKFPPSLLAAAAVYTAQCTLYGFRQWSKTCEWYSSYSETQLSECSQMMVRFHQKAATGKLTGVHRKYCSSKRGYTAKYKPADFLLDTQQ